MRDIWMAIAPGLQGTRVTAMAGPTETILKARLMRSPAHPRAMATLLEAVAMWQGAKVRAVLGVPAEDEPCDSNFYREAFTDFGGPLYTLDWVPARRRGQRHRDLEGIGDFADLRQMLLFEVAR
jgi:hypothetical protein